MKTFSFKLQKMSSLSSLSSPALQRNELRVTTSVTIDRVVKDVVTAPPRTTPSASSYRAPEILCNRLMYQNVRSAIEGRSCFCPPVFDGDGGNDAN